MATDDNTMRIIWHNGKPYGVSSTPFGHLEPATDWHILMPSGWLPLFPITGAEEWSSIEQRVIDWLDAGEQS